MAKFVLLQVPADLGNHTVSVALESVDVWLGQGFDKILGEDYSADIAQDDQQNNFTLDVEEYWTTHEKPTPDAEAVEVVDVSAPVFAVADVPALIVGPDGKLEVPAEAPAPEEVVTDKPSK